MRDFLLRINDLKGIAISNIQRLGPNLPALFQHRLEDQGCLAAAWKASSTGRQSRFYRLTPKGRGRLQAETQHWGRLTRAVGLVLDTAKGAAS